MCGIAGTVNHNIELKRFIPFLKHRGPDAQSTYSKENIQLHHFRLSILDLEGGVQPMKYQNLTIVFNGEIYNHNDVRKQLDLKCESSSDTETILHAYKKIGPGCLDLFDGMFVFAIYDEDSRSLFLCRDRAGKKPIYYYHNNEKFIFSSELRALQKNLNLDIDEKNINKYLKGCLYGQDTVYKNVYQLDGGQYLKLNCSNLAQISINKWWGINTFYQKSKLDQSKEDLLDLVDNSLVKAVKRRIDSSDLEVGTFLSGGIDSGLVTSIAANHFNDIKSFTVRFKDSPYDESDLARLVADKYKTNHFEIDIGFDNLINDIEGILQNYGEPFSDSSAIPSYYVAKAAKKHVTVTLNGDGADEIFAGYRRYVAFSTKDFFTRSYTNTLAKSLIKLLPKSNSKKSYYNFAYRYMQLLANNGVENYWFATGDTFIGHFENFYDQHDPFSHISDFLVKNEELSGLSKIMNLDFDILLRNLLLKKMDIATMANSLEGRSPLLCKELLEMAPRLPNKYKINGIQTKWILRELAKKYLPDELINQPKRGFEIPLKKWMDEDLKEIVFDYLDNKKAYSNNYINPKFITELLHAPHKFPLEKRAKMLYKLFALEVWHRDQN